MVSVWLYCWTYFLGLDMKTILDKLEAQGVNANAQCREGYCGSCRCKLIDGEPKYITEPIAYIGDNEMLPCIVSVDSNIVIEVIYEKN